MTKTEFIIELTEKLSSLPADEVEQRVGFYSEIIDDYIEEGMSEQEAIAKIGTTDEVAAQILSEIPISALVREKIKKKRKMRGWEITLLILGFPLWLPLLIAALAVIFALYVSLWSIVVTLWAVEVALWGCAFGGLASGTAFVFSGNVPSGLFMIASSIVCAGLSIFLFYGCKAATKGMVLLGKKMLLGAKNRLIKKEGAK